MAWLACWQSLFFFFFFFEQQIYILCGMNYKAVVMEMLLKQESICCVLWKLQSLCVYKHLSWMPCNLLDGSMHHSWVWCSHSATSCFTASFIFHENGNLRNIQSLQENWNILNCSEADVLSKKCNLTQKWNRSSYKLGI